MATRQSRLKLGTLTLDSLSFASQAHNVRIVPKSKADGDSLEMLDGSTLGGDVTTEYQLVITAVQDFDDPAGFVRTSWDLDGETVPFSWKANATAPVISGDVLVTPVEVGGKVNTRLDTEAEWTIPVKPSWATGA